MEKSNSWCKDRSWRIFEEKQPLSFLIDGGNCSGGNKHGQGRIARTLFKASTNSAEYLEIYVVSRAKCAVRCGATLFFFLVPNYGKIHFMVVVDVGITEVYAAFYNNYASARLLKTSRYF